jgi:hypothetical protein
MTTKAREIFNELEEATAELDATKLDHGEEWQKAVERTLRAQTVAIAFVFKYRPPPNGGFSI